MSRLQGPSSLKRKQPNSSSPLGSLTEQGRIIYNVIRNKQGKGIWTRDMKRKAKLPENVANKCLESLQAKRLIKEVVNIQNKRRKHYMATEFKPSPEITGGAWYDEEGKLNRKLINTTKLAALEGIFDALKNIGNSDVESTHVGDIVRALVLDNQIVEVKSNGMGGFESIPVGKVCYKCASKGSRGDPRIGAMASIPCGVCPRISDCTPDGILSPKTCKYYTQWLDF